MTYLQDHVVTLMVFVFAVTFCLLLLAPLWMHLGWRRDRQGRGGWYVK